LRAAGVGALSTQRMIFYLDGYHAIADKTFFTTRVAFSCNLYYNSVEKSSQQQHSPLNAINIKAFMTTSFKITFIMHASCKYKNKRAGLVLMLLYGNMLSLQSQKIALRHLHFSVWTPMRINSVVVMIILWFRVIAGQ